MCALPTIINIASLYDCMRLRILLFMFLIVLVMNNLTASNYDDSKLKNCLCYCGCTAANWNCAAVTCAYDPDGSIDTGSPSCANLSNGECVCSGFGCGRVPMVTSGECYDKCVEKYGAPKCGDGNCETDKDENCETCPSDCACPDDMVCDTNSMDSDVMGCATPEENDEDEDYVWPESGDIDSGDDYDEGWDSGYDNDYETEESPEDEGGYDEQPEQPEQNEPEQAIEDCTNGIDDDEDGSVDCSDSDCMDNSYCLNQRQLELAQSIKNRYLEQLKTYGLTMYSYDINDIFEKYHDNPELAVQKMHEYMDKKVYHTKKINSMLKVFNGSKDDYNNMLQIISQNKNDPIMRDIQLEEYVYKHSKTEKQKAIITELIIKGVLEPPKWLVGGEYNSGGVLDWSSFATQNFEKVGDVLKIKGNTGIKMFNHGTKVFMVVQDAKTLLKHADDLKNMNLDNNAKVSIIVLDGATKIGKILDPTGYFGNMADATVGQVIELRKKIENRQQGCITWNGRVLCDPDNTGTFEDYETGKKYNRVSGGWFSRAVYVEAEE